MARPGSFRRPDRTAQRRAQLTTTRRTRHHDTDTNAARRDGTRHGPAGRQADTQNEWMDGWMGGRHDGWHRRGGTSGSPSSAANRAPTIPIPQGHFAPEECTAQRGPELSRCCAGRCCCRCNGIRAAVVKSHRQGQCTPCHASQRNATQRSCPPRGPRAPLCAVSAPTGRTLLDAFF